MSVCLCVRTAPARQTPGGTPHIGPPCAGPLSARPPKISPAACRPPGLTQNDLRGARTPTLTHAKTDWPKKDWPKLAKSGRANTVSAPSSPLLSFFFFSVVHHARNSTQNIQQSKLCVKTDCPTRRRGTMERPLPRHQDPLPLLPRLARGRALEAKPDTALGPWAHVGLPGPLRACLGLHTAAWAPPTVNLTPLPALRRPTKGKKKSEPESTSTCAEFTMAFCNYRVGVLTLCPRQNTKPETLDDNASLARGTRHDEEDSWHPPRFL